MTEASEKALTISQGPPCDADHDGMRQSAPFLGAGERQRENWDGGAEEAGRHFSPQTNGFLTAENEFRGPLTPLARRGPSRR